MEYTEEQQKDHELVMQTICESFLKKKLPMVLKGGTALKLCYGLDRFSEDLDFDSAKPLNLESSIQDVFSQLGKGQAKFRNPKISLTKKTDTVRRYRVTYADNINLKIETSMRGTPDDKDLTRINGILTYKIPSLIKQKLSALQGRTTARDLHDVIYLYETYFDDFKDEEIASIQDLYDTQSTILDRFNPAYDEDTMLSTSDLLSDLMKLIDLVESRDDEGDISS
jgi:predicted nucleotidyltransferase component of viral defense system